MRTGRYPRGGCTLCGQDHRLDACTDPRRPGLGWYVRTAPGLQRGQLVEAWFVLDRIFYTMGRPRDVRMGKQEPILVGGRSGKAKGRTFVRMFKPVPLEKVRGLALLNDTARKVLVPTLAQTDELRASRRAFLAELGVDNPFPHLL